MAQGQQPIKSLGFLGWETTNLGLSQQFLLISSRSRGKLPAGVYSEDYCPALRILGVLGDPVPARHTEGVVVNSRVVDLLR